MIGRADDYAVEVLPLQHRTVVEGVLPGGGELLLGARRRGAETSQTAAISVLSDLAGRPSRYVAGAAHAEFGDPDAVVGARDAAVGSSREEC